MIKRIKTEEGERWAMVFDKTTALEEISQTTLGLIDLMITATGSDLFESSQSGFYSALDIVRSLIITPEQANEHEKYLRETGQIIHWAEQKEK